MTKYLLCAATLFVGIASAPSTSSAEKGCKYQNKVYPSGSELCVPGGVLKQCRRGLGGVYIWRGVGRCQDPRRPGVTKKPVYRPFRPSAKPRPGVRRLPTPACWWAKRRYPVNGTICAIGGRRMRCVANNQWRRVGSCRSLPPARPMKPVGIVATSCRYQNKLYKIGSKRCVKPGIIVVCRRDRKWHGTARGCRP